jgi:hypothetical protein
MLRLREAEALTPVASLWMARKVVVFLMRRRPVALLTAECFRALAEGPELAPSIAQASEVFEGRWLADGALAKGSAYLAGRMFDLRG